MIVKGIRIRTASGITRTIRHVQNGDENDEVVFLSGTPADIQDMHRDAVANNATYAVRHWIVAPHYETTRSQMQQILNVLAKEFEFDAAGAVVIEHRKKRATKDAVDVHWHVLLGEVDPATGRILKNSYDRIKHELVSRISEFTFGHPFVMGKHTASVIRGLRARKLGCIADRLEQAFDPSAPIPSEAFSHGQHQQKKRMGIDLPGLRQLIKSAVNASVCRADLVQSLAPLGLEIRPGDKPGTWVLFHTAHGVFVGALHRLAGMRKSEVTILMEKPLAQAHGVMRLGNTDEVSEPNSRHAEHEPSARQPTIIEDAALNLHKMERAALRDLGELIPGFQPTQAMRNTSSAVRRATDDFSKVTGRRSELQRQLFIAPPVRWWCHLTGAAKWRSAKIRELKTKLEEIDTDLRLKELAVSAARAREVREEKFAKEAHAAIVREIAQRHATARRTLAIVEEAKAILDERPDISGKGLDNVLARAKARFREKEDVASRVFELGTDHRFVR